MKYFGYAASGETLDGIRKTSGFTNFAHFSASAERADRERIQLMKSQGQKALIGLHDLLFAKNEKGWSLHPDYKARWKHWTELQGDALDPSRLIAFFIADEPAHNGISYEDLQKATALVKTTFPSVPTLTVESSVSLKPGLKIPPEIDWISFDHYGVRDPRSDKQYQEFLSFLKKTKSSRQKLVIVMDSWWAAGIHGAHGLSEKDMAEVARNYYELANAEPDAVAIGAFLWADHFDEGKAVQSLDPSVIEAHREIGEKVLRKPFGPSTAKPSVSNARDKRIPEASTSDSHTPVPAAAAH